MYAYLKAIHIIFIVTWFAGLFYFPRLLIYDVEARSISEPAKSILVNQYRLMQKRLWYGITWPSMILTLILGPWLVESAGFMWSSRWLIVKLILVVGLIAYHFSLHYIMHSLRGDDLRFSSTFLRIWNEVATLFLVSIVFIVVLKNELDMIYGLLGLLGLILLLMAGIRVYKAVRTKQ